jgi:hypothetical protein
MNHQFVCENIARQLASVWAIHRDPAFVKYLLQTFGCEPLKPVRFAGIFSIQMIGGYFFPDLPAGPGPVVEGMWLTDDTGFRPSSMKELLPVENLDSENPLVVYDQAHRSYQPIRFQPLLLLYPRFNFCVREDKLIYIEQFGNLAGCKKVGKLVIGDSVSIQDVCVTFTMWQGHPKHPSGTGQQS